METSIDSGLSAIVAVEKEQTVTKSRIKKFKIFILKKDYLNFMKYLIFCSKFSNQKYSSQP